MPRSPNPKPDVRAVARAAKVSTATVSRVLNLSPKVREETRRRVSEVLERLGYVPEGIASRSVALFLETGDGLHVGAYASILLSALTRALAHAGFHYEVFPISHCDRACQRAIRAAVCLTWSEEARSRLRQRHPAFTVMVNDRVPGLPGVCSDHRGQAASAVAHLAQLGHRRIGLLLNSLANWGGSERVKGWKATLEGRGLPVDRSLCRATLPAEVLPQVAALMDRGATALLIGGEDLALPAYHACAKLGLSIPRDLSLITFENPGVSPWLTPEPTTIDQDAPALARGVLDQLNAFFSGVPAPAAPLVPARLIVRASTAGAKRS
ncbi:MAG: LacI family DNA-binding transcriptional regulator [Spirochaetes bacterium]|nr:LacI family DNA-binding transcriptional regulator [Spirochaetota bacterium]